MPRSNYIYIVENQSCNLLAAFTVKHEMVSWLEGFEARHRGVAWQASRVPDGDAAHNRYYFRREELLA